MSFIEPVSFCSLEEYRRHEPDRIQLDSIEADELYTYMTRLRSPEREASRSTIRVIGQTVTSNILPVVFYDSKLNESHEAEIVFDDEGYAEPIRPLELFDHRNQRAAPIIRGYLRDYFQDMYDAILAQSNEKELVS